MCILPGLPSFLTSLVTSTLNSLLQPASKLAWGPRSQTAVLCLYLLCSKGEEDVEQVPAETLYQGLLPSLPQYMVSAPALGPLRCLSLVPAVGPPAPLPSEGRLLRASPASPQIALLKILLAAAPTSKAKTDSINILADVLPEEMP